MRNKKTLLATAVPLALSLNLRGFCAVFIIHAAHPAPSRTAHAAVGSLLAGANPIVHDLSHLGLYTHPHGLLIGVVLPNACEDYLKQVFFGRRPEMSGDTVGW